MNNLKFSNWLKDELDNRGWSQNEFAKRTYGEISQSYVSLVLDGKKPITWGFCAATAQALGYSPIEVFRIAGLLPNGKTTANEIADLLERLPPDKQQDLLGYAKYLISSLKKTA